MTREPLFTPMVQVLDDENPRSRATRPRGKRSWLASHTTGKIISDSTVMEVYTHLSSVNLETGWV